MGNYKIKQKIKIKGKNAPVFIEGEEAGVIATQVVEIDDPNDPIEIYAVIEAGEKLRDNTIEIVEEPVEGFAENKKTT